MDLFGIELEICPWALREESSSKTRFALIRRLIHKVAT
jgi:hypothetical protein